MLVPCQLSRPMKRSRRSWQLMRCVSNRPSPTETVPRRSPLSIWPPARSRSTGPTRNGIVCWTDPGTQFLATPSWQGTSCQNRPLFGRKWRPNDQNRENPVSMARIRMQGYRPSRQNCDRKSEVSLFIINMLWEWRRRWDSNPRYAFTHAGFQDQCIRPLCHSSGGALLSVAFRF